MTSKGAAKTDSGSAADPYLGVAESAEGKRWLLREYDERQALTLVQRYGLPDAVGRVMAARGIDAGAADVMGFAARVGARGQVATDACWICGGQQAKEKQTARLHHVSEARVRVLRPLTGRRCFSAAKPDPLWESLDGAHEFVTADSDFFVNRPFCAAA